MCKFSFLGLIQNEKTGHKYWISDKRFQKTADSLILPHGKNQLEKIMFVPIKVTVLFSWKCDCTKPFEIKDPSQIFGVLTTKVKLRLLLIIEGSFADHRRHYINN